MHKDEHRLKPHVPTDVVLFHLPFLPGVPQTNQNVFQEDCYSSQLPPFRAFRNFQVAAARPGVWEAQCKSLNSPKETALSLPAKLKFTWGGVLFWG